MSLVRAAKGGKLYRFCIIQDHWARQRLVQSNGQIVYLVQQSLVLSSRVLEHLSKLMIHRHAGDVRHGTLGLLDACHLELNEELGDLDGEVSSDGSNASLSCEVDIELVLELLQVVVGQRRSRRESVESEGEGRLARGGKVDGGESDAAGGDVRDAVDGCLRGVACNSAGERGGQSRGLFREGLRSD